MPQVIIQADVHGDEAAAITLAGHIEAGRRPDSARPHAGRPSRRTLIPTAVGVVMATLLLLASSAAAHPRREHHAHRHGGNGLSTSAVALNWYDITDRTITAAAYPERSHRAAPGP